MIGRFGESGWIVGTGKGSLRFAFPSSESVETIEFERLRGRFKKEFGTFDSYLWTNLYRLITNVSNEKSNEIKL